MGTKISQMPELSTANTDNVIPIVALGDNRKITVDNLKAYGTSLFISDVTKSTATDTAGVTPSKVNVVGSTFIVDSVSTQNNNVRVFVEWDGPYDEYKGTVTVNSVAVLDANTTQVSVDVRRFRGFADVVLSGTGLYANKIVVGHSAGSKLEVPVVFVAAPTVVDVEHTIPGGITEIPPELNFNVKVTATQSFSQVAIKFNGANETVYNVVSSTAGMNFAATFSVQLPSALIGARGTMTLTASAINANGATAFANPSNRTFTYNGYKPVVSAPTYTYPASQSAIKGAETVTVTWSLAGTNASLTSGLASGAMLVTGTSLSVGAVTYNSGPNTVTAVVSRGPSTLVLNTNNIQLVAKSNVNGYTQDPVVGQVNVAEAAVQLASNTAVVTKGGLTTAIASDFNQPVTIQSVTVSANRGTLDAVALPGGTVMSLTKSITVSASDVFSDSTNNLVITVKTASNATYVINRLYKIAGFAAVPLVLTAPQASVAIPFPIVNNANVSITNAYLNSSPALPLEFSLVSSASQFENATQYTLTNSPGVSPVLVINEKDLQGLYYTNGATITLNIEEL